MSDVAEAELSEDGAKPKSGKGGMLIALVGALVAGGGGFYATYSGMLSGDVGAGMSGKYDGGTYAFVPIEPIIVSLGPNATAETLRFRAELEVDPAATASVAELAPRIVDVLQDYLRAVDEVELEDPASLSLLRAQMLRRIQTVVGDGKVRDLLIMEFILT